MGWGEVRLRSRQAENVTSQDGMAWHCMAQCRMQSAAGERQVRMQLQAGGYQAAQHSTHLYGSSSSCKDGTASMPFVRLM